MKFQAWDCKGLGTQTAMTVQKVEDINSFLLSGIDVVEGDNWVVLNKRGGYAWNEVTGKYMPINRNGRKFEMELFVPDQKDAGEGWKNWNKTMKAQQVAPPGTKTHTHNKFQGLQCHGCEEQDWRLGFVGRS